MDEEEIDKDLTMLNGSEPTPKESAFDALLKNSTTIGSLSPVVDTQKKLDEAIRVSDVQAQFAESFQEGTVDPALDQGRSMFEDTESVRARNQSAWVKGIKAVGGGILGGGLIALEQVGYVADMDTYLNLFQETEDISGNFWTRMMKDAQEGLRESSTFRIYEQAPDVNSLSSQVFKWSSLEGAVSSAVGFGITGLGAAKLVSYLGSMKRFKDMAKFTDAVMGNLSGKGAEAMAGWTGSKVGPLASSGISNYFMGQMMATDTYNQTMEELSPYIGDGEGQISIADAQKKAAGNAQDVVGLNMALTMTAYLRFGGIFKRDAKLKGLVENPTLLNQMKGLIAKGSPTAFTENVYQEMIQMEQIHDTKKEFGIESEYSDNYWDRMSNLMLSNRALHAGALGIAGGPIQFAIIQRPMMGAQIAQQRKTYGEQTEARDWHQKVVANDFAKTIAFQNMITEAAVEGKLDDAKFVDNVAVLDKVAHTIDWGTLPYLRNDIENIQNFTPEQAAEAGYTEGYVQKAEEFLKVLDKAEVLTGKYTGMYNRGAVVFNRLVAEQSFDAFMNASNKAITLSEEIVTRGEAVMGLEKGKLGQDLKLVRDPKRFENKSPEEVAKLKKVEVKENDKLDNFLGNSYEYSLYQEVKADQAKYAKLGDDLYTDYKKITSPEYQAKGKESENKSAQEYKDDIQKAKQETAEAKTTTEASKYKPFATVKQEAKIESAEERIARQEAWSKDVKGRVVTNDRSFSSIDKNFDTRVFTPKDIVRSKDGRYFKVHTQQGSKNETGRVGANMPVLYEVQRTEKGKWVSMTAEDGSKLPFIEQLFELGTNTNFLREEVLQPEVFGKAVSYGETWAPYMVPDSLLRPNNALYQEGRRNMLDKNQAKTINISARELKNNTYPWMNDYDTSAANLPFTGPYDIVYKKAVGDQGQNIIDVYKVVEGGKDIKIARLDEEYNHNFALIRDALAKGPVTGSVVENFSSRKNIMRNLDDEGNRLDVNVTEFANMDSRYLPNGQVIIASKKGEWAGGQEAAATLDGVPIEGTSIVVDGESLEIPYDAMTPGDTYIIIRSPNGRLVPIATTSKSIEDIDIEGQSFTEAIAIPEIYKSINEIFEKELSTQSEDDSILREQVRDDNKVVNDSTIDDEGGMVFGPKMSRAFRNKKYASISDKREAFKNHLDQTIYQHIRNNNNLFIRESIDNDNRDLYEKNARGLKVINPDWFQIEFDISKKTGNIVPAVNIRNPRNFAEWHRTRNPGGGTKRFNIEDNPVEFFAALGRRRKKLSIDNLVTPKVDGVNKIMESANQGLIQANLNIQTPFVGSSITTEVNGDDIRSQSSELSTKLFKQFETRYGKILTETVRGISFNQSKYTAEEFTANVEEFLDPESEITNIKSLSIGENAADIEDSFNNFILSLNIKQSNQAQTYVTDVLNKDLTDEETVAVDEIKGRLEDQGLIDNLDLMSRIVLATQGIKDKIEAGDLKLRPKAGRGTSELNTEKMTQLEAKTFSKNAHVFSELHGESTVFKRRQDGLYVIRKKGKTKSHTVYPNDIVSFFGDHKKLVDLKKALSKTNKTDPKYVSMTRSINRIEGDIEYKRQKRDGTLEVVAPDGSTVSNTSLIDFHDKLQAVPGEPSKRVDFFKRISKSERSDQIAAAYSVLNAELDAIDNIEEFLDAGTAEKVVLASRDAIFYTDQELKDLHEQAVDTKNESFRVKIEALQEVKDALAEMDDFETPLSVDIQRWNPKKKTISDTIFQVLTTQVKVRGGKTEGNINGDIDSYIRDFSGLMYGVIRAESAIRADLYKPVNEPATEVTPIKSEPKQDIIESAKIETVTDTSKKGEVVTNTQKMKDMGISDDYIGVANNLETADLEAFITEYKQYYSEGLDTSGVIARHLPKFRLEEGATLDQDQFDFEVKYAKQMLPQVPIEVVENVVAMYNKFGAKAIGAYDKGVRFLANNAATGTAYHETFHAVADIYLRPFQKQQIAEENGYEKWNLELEEKLAEEFSAYVDKLRAKPRPLGKITSSVKRFFQGMLDWIKGIRSADVTTKIFEKIVTGGFAKSESFSTLATTNERFNSPEEFGASISQNNRVLLQELMAANQIKIIC